MQGDPKAGGEFNVAIQKDVVKLEQELKQTGGLARFGQDDGYGVGHPDSLFPGVRVFSSGGAVWSRAGSKQVRTLLQVQTGYLASRLFARCVFGGDGG